MNVYSIMEDANTTVLMIMAHTIVLVMKDSLYLIMVLAVKVIQKTLVEMRLKYVLMCGLHVLCIHYIVALQSPSW